MEVEKQQPPPPTPSLQKPPPQKNNPLTTASLPSFTPAQSLEEEESLLQRKLTIFGTDVGEIPCFRNSFLYGIGGGLGAGIVHFAISSKLQKATKFGFWTYVGVTFGYWCHCRYEYTMLKQEYTRLQFAMKHAAGREGTAEMMSRDSSRDS